MTGILVTGGSGFIGTNLVEYFRQQSIRLLSLDILPPKRGDHAPWYQRVDILDLPSLRDAVESFQPDILIHLAARTDLYGQTMEDYAANIEGVRNIVEVAASVSSLCQLIVASSRLVCEIGYQPKSDTDYRPTTPYGASKVQTEQIVRGAGLNMPWTLVRPTSIWGQWFGVPYDLFFRLIQRGLYVHPRGRTIRKSFGYVGNTVHQLACLTGSHNSAAEHTLYLCDYPPLEVSQWAETIREALNAPPIRQVPYGILKAGAFAGDALAKIGMNNPPLTSFRLDNLLCEMIYDTGPLEAICGKPPFSADEGVRATAAWMLHPADDEKSSSI